MINIGGQQDDLSYRYKMPSLKSKKEGRGNGTKTAISNLSDISKSLNIDPIYPAKFMGIELCSHSSYNKKTERGIVNGHHSTETLQKILQTFIVRFILCDRCKLPETTMHVDKKREKVVKKCAACGIKTRVDPTHRLTSFVAKKPPSYKKTALKDHKKSKIKKQGKSSKPSVPKKNSNPMTDNPDEKAAVEEIQIAAENDDNSVSSEDGDDLFDKIPPASEEFTKGEQENGQNKVSQDFGVQKSRKQTSILSDMLRKDRPVEELIAEVGRMELATPAEKIAGKLLIAQGVISALFSEMKAKEALQEIESKKRFLSAFVSLDVRNPENFLEALEEYVGVKKPELLPSAPMLLEKLYDCEVLTEETILGWFEAGRSADDPVRKNCAVFIEWLKTAEEESSDD